MTPRPDQLEDFLKLREWPRASNYSQVGVGKSLVSFLYIIDKLLQGKKVLVLMPPTLIFQFKQEFQVIKGHDFTVASFHPDRATRLKDMSRWDVEGWPDVLITSYPLFLKHYRSLDTADFYNVIITDEAHVLSRFTNKAFQKLNGYMSFREVDLLLMTATPCTTELETAYGHIKLKFPSAYSSYEQFERMHVDFVMQPINDKAKIKQIVGYRDPEVIGQHLMANSVRRLKKDVLSLSELNIYRHQVLLEDRHMLLYQQLLQERMLELGDEIHVAHNKQALRQMALQLITNPSKYADASHLEDVPLETLKAIADSLPLQKTKLLIFCNFKATVLKLASEFQHLNPALIYGDSDTDLNIQKLLNDPSCRLGILNYASGGAGLNLQSISHYMVCYEALGSPGMLEQAIGRIHRGGQKQPCVVWVLDYVCTVSSKLLGKIKDRAEYIRVAVGDTVCLNDFIVENDENFLDNTLKLL